MQTYSRIAKHDGHDKGGPVPRRGNTQNETTQND